MFKNRHYIFTNFKASFCRSKLCFVYLWFPFINIKNVWGIRLKRFAAVALCHLCWLKKERGLGLKLSISNSRSGFSFVAVSYVKVKLWRWSFE